MKINEEKVEQWKRKRDNMGKKEGCGGEKFTKRLACIIFISKYNVYLISIKNYYNCV